MSWILLGVALVVFAVVELWLGCISVRQTRRDLENATAERLAAERLMAGRDNTGHRLISSEMSPAGNAMHCECGEVSRWPCTPRDPVLSVYLCGAVRQRHLEEDEYPNLTGAVMLKGAAE